MLLAEIVASWPVLALVAVVSHEAGHAAAAQLLGLRWHPFARLPWKAGIAVEVPQSGLRARDDLLVALAGPAASLALAAAALPSVAELALISGMLAVLNLLPFLPGSDGWRATGAIRRAWRACAA
jgi:Zn-dependent protease